MRDFFRKSPVAPFVDAAVFGGLYWLAARQVLHLSPSALNVSALGFAIGAFVTRVVAQRRARGP